MPTEKQIAANRRNSQASTGPRTARGKSFSRLNSLRHGLRAKTVPLPAEDPRLLAQFRRLFMASCRSPTPDQIRLLEQMAQARASQFHWQRIENQILAAADSVSSIMPLLDRLSQRQTRYQRAFLNACRQYRRATRRKPQTEQMSEA
ncbi:MAG: hypothetical protein ABSH50_14430 [Bryobacteraceae bacterium]|jgi:hypothetical protein